MTQIILDILLSEQISVDLSTKHHLGKIGHTPLCGRKIERANTLKNKIIQKQQFQTNLAQPWLNWISC